MILIRLWSLQPFISIPTNALREFQQLPGLFHLPGKLSAIGKLAESIEEIAMEYEFTFGDKQYSVNIDKIDSENSVGLEVNINGEPSSFSASPISSNCYLLSSKNKNLRIYAASNDGNVFVCVNGQVVKLGKISGDQQKFSREGLEFGAKDQITTPMPGKIVKILVAEGEKVAAKQPLVIVESMKMENEIKSPANGIIKSIHFKAGDLVESGQPIIKIIPDDAP